MNSKARRFRVHPCVVCGYLFSDKHHIYAQRDGGRGGETVYLCPNHHRYANMVQSMADQGVLYADVEVFAAKHFDQAFNEKALRALFYGQITGFIGAAFRRLAYGPDDPRAK